MPYDDEETDLKKKIHEGWKDYNPNGEDNGQYATASFFMQCTVVMLRIQKIKEKLEKQGFLFLPKRAEPCPDLTKQFFLS
jgi:hypothetical protein